MVAVYTRIAMRRAVHIPIEDKVNDVKVVDLCQFDVIQLLPSGQLGVVIVTTPNYCIIRFDNGEELMYSDDDIINKAWIVGELCSK